MKIASSQWKVQVIEGSSYRESTVMRRLDFYSLYKLGSQVLQVNTFARIESACMFRDGLSFFIKSISLIRQSNLSEPLVST